MKKVEYSNIKGIKYVGEDFKTWEQEKKKPIIDTKIKKKKKEDDDTSGSSERD